MSLPVNKVKKSIVDSFIDIVSSYIDKAEIVPDISKYRFVQNRMVTNILMGAGG